MATSTLKQGFTSTEALTLTYTQNPYVSESNFNRLKAYKKNGVLWFVGNLGTSGAVTSAQTTVIGTISGWSAPYDTYTCIPGQSDPTKVIMLQITTGGTIQFYAFDAPTQWYRANIVALSSS